MHLLIILFNKPLFFNLLLVVVNERIIVRKVVYTETDDYTYQADADK